MRSLVPCPCCQRHVKAGETACPFCRTALVASPDSNVCQGPCSGHAFPRLGRVALLAVGATLLCAECMRSTIVEYGVPIILRRRKGHDRQRNARRRRARRRPRRGFPAMSGRSAHRARHITTCITT